MIDIKNLTIDISASIKDALSIINEGSKQIALVVDKDNKLLGTISDGDIRRALLNNIPLNATIENIYFKSPTTASIDDTKEHIINICITKKLHQIPIVDRDSKLIGLEILDELLLNKEKSNRVVLMVGGLGSRLRPLTDTIPKPMLKVGDKPILETIIERFVKYGFVNIILCVNYKAEIIRDYFGDGSKFKANIKYVYEDKKMGTAGALSLIQESIDEAFFVMNGDLLTNLNFGNMMNSHILNQAKATMGVREYNIEIPYGVLNIKNNIIQSIDEKPKHNFFINAGIYILDSDIIEFIPKDKFYDMPTLFEKLIALNYKTLSYVIMEYWLDIGQIKEYERANIDYFKVF